MSIKMEQQALTHSKITQLPIYRCKIAKEKQIRANFN
jgi:hypothetical protein